MPTTQEQDATDIELIAATARGDTKAFEQLYRRHENRIYHYVRTFVQDNRIAQEVLSDVMFIVWQEANSFRQASRVSTWILGIARHKALNVVRESARRRKFVELDEMPEREHPAPSQFETLSEQERAALVRQALSKLSDDHKEIIRLAFYEELPYKEIAQLLGIPPDTVKTRVYYAKKHLKTFLPSGCLDESADQ